MDPDVAYALARSYNNWIADFCQAAPRRLFAAAMLLLQAYMDYALEELLRARNIECFRAAFIRPMFIEGCYFTHPYYDPLWDELQQLCLAAAVHPTAGLWNPEWTSHGPFAEKVKGRLNRFQFIAAPGGGPFAGGSTTGSVSGSPPPGHPDCADSLALARQSYVYRIHTHPIQGHAPLPMMRVVMEHGKASWMEEILEKMEASTRTFPLRHFYPFRTDTEQM